MLNRHGKETHFAWVKKRGEKKREKESSIVIVQLFSIHVCIKKIWWKHLLCRSPRFRHSLCIWAKNPISFWVFLRCNKQYVRRLAMQIVTPWHKRANLGPHLLHKWLWCDFTPNLISSESINGRSVSHSRTINLISCIGLHPFHYWICIHYLN